MGVRGRLPERVEVDVRVTDKVLRRLIRDDGAGGADPSRGSGLIGLSDRIEAAGGKIEITSPPGTAPRSRSPSRWSSPYLAP